MLGRPQHRRTWRADRLRRPAGHRADHPPEAARRIPAREFLLKPACWTPSSERAELKRLHRHGRSISSAARCTCSMLQLSGAGKRFGHKLLFRGRRLADHAGRPHRPGGRQRHRQDHAAEDPGRAGDARLRRASGPRAAPPATCRRTAWRFPAAPFSPSACRSSTTCAPPEAELESAHPAHGASWTRRARSTSEVADRFQRLDSEFRTRDGYALEAQVGAVLTGLGFPKEDWTTAHRGVLRRLADAHRAGQAAAREAQPPAARRAHQPPRPGSAQLAGAVPARLPVRLRAGLARPLLPGRHRAARSSSSGTGSCTSTRATTRAISSRRRSAGRSSRPPTRTSRTASASSKPSSTASATRPPRPSRCRAASRSWRRSSDRAAARRRRPSTSPFPQPKPSGRMVAEFRGVAKSYGEQARLRRRQLHHRARRPRGAGGRERRGQIHADQDAGGHRAADRRRVHAGPQRRSPTTSRRTSTRSSTRRRACSTTWRSVAPATPLRPSCAACWAASCSPKTMCSSRSACSPAASATATRWRACCCSPSNFLLLDEPTNHLDLRAKDVLLEALQELHAARWSSSRTTATSSTSWPRASSRSATAQVHVYPGQLRGLPVAQGRHAAAEASPSRRPAAGAAGCRPRPTEAQAQAPEPDPLAADEGTPGSHRGGGRAAGGRDRRIRIGAGGFQERRGDHPPQRTCSGAAAPTSKPSWRSGKRSRRRSSRPVRLEPAVTAGYHWQRKGEARGRSPGTTRHPPAQGRRASTRSTPDGGAQTRRRPRPTIAPSRYFIESG